MTVKQLFFLARSWNCQNDALMIILFIISSKVAYNDNVEYHIEKIWLQTADMSMLEDVKTYSSWPLNATFDPIKKYGHQGIISRIETKCSKMLLYDSHFENNIRKKFYFVNLPWYHKALWKIPIKLV